MAYSEMAARLLDAADLLLQNAEMNIVLQRRAISTAYYAVFHSIVELCADYVTQSADLDSKEYVSVYRALDHAPLKAAFSQSPLKDNDKFTGIGAAVVRLQSERHRADYLPHGAGLFTYSQARELFSLALDVVSKIEEIKLNSDECRTLALSLLFKERKS